MTARLPQLSIKLGRRSESRYGVTKKKLTLAVPLRLHLLPHRPHCPHAGLIRRTHTHTHTLTHTATHTHTHPEKRLKLTHTHTHTRIHTHAHTEEEVKIRKRDQRQASHARQDNASDAVSAARSCTSVRMPQIGTYSYVSRGWR